MGIMHSINRLRILLIVFCAWYTILLPTRTNSRYLPFLETPDEYVVRDTITIRPAAMIAYAGNAYRRNYDEGALIDLWGKYNLQSVVNGLQYVNPNYVNPFKTYYPGGGSTWIDPLTQQTKNLVYAVIGKIKIKGVTLSATIPFAQKFYIGAWVPFFHVNSSYRYELDTSAHSLTDGAFHSLKPGELLALDLAHQQVHQDLGLMGNLYQKTGCGDVDLFIGFQDSRSYWMRLRELSYGVRLGMLLPSSKQRAANYPTAIPMMGSGHFSLYGDVYASAELKYNLRVGAILGYRLGFSATETRRMATLNEPSNFGPLVVDVRVTPPSTFKASPFVTLENVMDGLHIQGRYTYLLLSEEKVSDTRSNPAVQTYLTREAGPVMFAGATTPVVVAQQDVNNALHDQKRLASGRSQYVSVSLCYDPAQALMTWPADPTFFINYDYCIGGAAVAKTHQLTLGVSLQF